MSMPAKVERFPRLRRSRSDVNDVIGAFESETVAVFARTAPVNEHIILYVLVAMLVLSITLSAIVKLDKVVTGGGLLRPVGGSLYVSPFNAGIVKQVMVKVGDVVKKGQVLATLDPTFTNADYEQLRLRQASDEAQIARLQAEQVDQPYIAGNGSFDALQATIWQQRQAEYHSTLADFDGRIHSIEAQVTQAQKDANEYAKRSKLAEDVEKMYRPLMEKGYVSKLQWMSASDTVVEVGRLQAEAHNQIEANLQNLASLKAQRESYIRKWQSDVGTQLVTVRNDYDQTRQSLEKAIRLQELLSLEAPADAIVLKIGKVSSGSIASTGSNAGDPTQEPLFTLVPLDAPVEAEVKVDSRDIGFIKQGDPVQLKLDAYRFLQHGTAKGVIKTISEGSFSVDENNQPVSPYFKVDVTIEELKLRNVPADFRVIPGMTLQGDIMVGKRTILSYLVEGALRTGSEAMREP